MFACASEGGPTGAPAPPTSRSESLAPNEHTAALQRYGLIPDVGADLSLVSELDEAGGPPGSTTYVGHIAETDTFLGVRLFEGGDVSVFVYQGMRDNPATIREWASGRLAGDSFRAESGDKPLTTPGEIVVAGRRDASAIAGTLTFPDGRIVPYRAEKATGLALLLRIEGKVSARPVDQRHRLGDFGVIRDDGGGPEQPTEGGPPAGATIAQGWIRLHDGRVAGGCTCYDRTWWCQCQYGHWHNTGHRCGL